MLATCVAALGTADAAYHPGTPELTCVADQVRITATGPRRVTFSPIANDFTNDGAAIFLDTVQALDASRGTLTRDGDLLTYEAPEGFAGTFDIAYTAQSTTGATDDGTIAFIVEGTTTTPFCTGVPDTIDVDGSTVTLDYDVLANDTGTGPLEIMPGSLVQPPSGPTISIQDGKLRVTRNGAGTGTYIGSYRPRLVDGSAVGDATQVTIQVVAATVMAADFAVTVPTSAAQPFKIDALARCSGTGPIELTPGGLTQPNGATDSAAINGSGATGWIDYTRSTTPAGSYTMRYRVRLIANPGVEATGTITINVTAAWWRKSPIPGAREMFSGPGYFDASYPKWPEQIGAIGAITQQIMYRGTSDQSWEGIWGGTATQALNALTIQNNSQCDWGNTFGAAARSIPPDSAFLCGVCQLFPDSWATATSATNRNERIYDEVASGRLDDGYLRFGARLYKAFRALGWTDTDWFILRPVHEMNQSNTCWVFKETRMRYRAMAERIFTKMREGFGARLRIIHSPARNFRLNNKMTAEDYYDWVPQSATGGVDMLTVSFHPAGPVDTLANLDKFLRRWDNQSYGTIDDVLPSCAQLGLPYCNPEWSPRYEVQGSIQPCPIGDVVMQQMNKLLRAQAAQGNLVFETMFDQRQLIKTAYEGTDAAGKAAWSRMVDDIKALWKSQPKGAPPSLRITGSTSVTLSGDSLDFNAIGVMTGSEAVRIKRIVSTTGGLSASITGADANAKVRIQRGSASPGGGKTVVAEMTLQSIPFLVDLELSVSVVGPPATTIKNATHKVMLLHRPLTGILQPFASIGSAVTRCVYANGGAPVPAAKTQWDHSDAGIAEGGDTLWAYMTDGRWSSGAIRCLWADMEVSARVKDSKNVPASVGYNAATDDEYAACYRYNVRQELRTEAIRYQLGIFSRFLSKAAAAGYDNLEIGHYNVPGVPSFGSEDTAGPYDTHFADILPLMNISSFGGPFCYFGVTANNQGWTRDQHINRMVASVQGFRAKFGASMKIMPAIWVRWHKIGTSLTPNGSQIIPSGWIGPLVTALLTAGADGFVAWVSSADDGLDIPTQQARWQEVVTAINTYNAANASTAFRSITWS